MTRATIGCSANANCFLKISPRPLFSLSSMLPGGRYQQYLQINNQSDSICQLYVSVEADLVNQPLADYLWLTAGDLLTSEIKLVQLNHQLLSDPISAGSTRLIAFGIKMDESVPDQFQNSELEFSFLLEAECEMEAQVGTVLATSDSSSKNSLIQQGKRSPPTVPTVSSPPVETGMSASNLNLGLILTYLLLTYLCFLFVFELFLIKSTPKTKIISRLIITGVACFILIVITVFLRLRAV